MNKFRIIFDEETPKYVQIANKIKKSIRDGVILQDEKLPAIRRLAVFLGVNKDTIVKAYDKLQADGAAYQKMGSGSYAKCKDDGLQFKKEYSNILKSISKMELNSYLDFSGESINVDHFHVEVFKDIINRVIDRDGIEVFMEKEPLGYVGLRESISTKILNDISTMDNLIIVSGAQQGIDIVSRSIININDNIIVERPTYAGALSVFKYRRANIFQVELENDGINIEELEKILKKNKVKALYTMSYFQNPTGINISREKKKRLIELAEEYDFYIIEDDYLSEMIYDEDIQYESLKSIDKADRVIYIKSFSKLFLPGIRLGFVLGTRETIKGIIKSKINTDIATSSLMQRALDTYIRDGQWDKQIISMKKEYSQKYNTLCRILKKELSDYVKIIEPGGGMSFFIKIKKEKFDDRELFYNCLKRKVIITPGRIFFTRFKKEEGSFRISFGKLSIDESIQGIAIIKEEMEKLVKDYEGSELGKL